MYLKCNISTNIFRSNLKKKKSAVRSSFFHVIYLFFLSVCLFSFTLISSKYPACSAPRSVLRLAFSVDVGGCWAAIYRPLKRSGWGVTGAHRRSFSVPITSLSSTTAPPPSSVTALLTSEVICAHPKRRLFSRWCCFDKLNAVFFFKIKKYFACEDFYATIAEYYFYLLSCRYYW